MITSVSGMYTTTVTRLVRAPRASVFAALVDAAAIARWRVPDGMQCEVHDFDPREGGRFRISLTYDAGAGTGKSGGHTDTYHGHFIQLVPDEQVVEVIQFESTDTELTAPMTITTTLRDAPGGTSVEIRHEAVPDSVRPEDNETGTRMALDKLAGLVETD